MDRPALNGPAIRLHDALPAEMVDVALTLLLGGLQMSVDAPGVALAAMDVIVVHNGDDARRRSPAASRPRAAGQRERLPCVACDG